MSRGARGRAAARRLRAALAGLVQFLVMSAAAHAGPAADISAPTQITAGEDFVLGGSGSRLPPLLYFWTLESLQPPGPPPTEIEGMLAAATTANADSVMLPAASLTPGVTYEFRLTVMDLLRETDFVTHSVEVMPARAPVPALSDFGRVLLALALCLAVLLRQRLPEASAT